MKTSLKFLAVVSFLMCTSASPAYAWHCNAGSHWVQTSGQTNVEVGSCFPDTPPIPVDPKSSNSATSNSNSTANSASNSTAISNSSAIQKQTQNQNQSQTATGGNATASNGGQQNAQDVNIVNQTNVPRQTASAIAPDTLPTAPCFKTYSGAGQTGTLGLSFGGGKVDKGCDDRETARLFAVAGNRQAFAKIMCQTPAAKRAHLTIQDCLQVAPAIVSVSVVPNPQPTIIVVPSQPAVAPVPVQTVVPVVTAQPAARLTLIGTFRMDLTPGSSLCPSTRAIVTEKGTIVLNRGTAQLGNGKILLRSNLRNGAASMRYLRTKGVSKDRVLLTIDDEQNQTVEVSVWEDK